MFLFPTHWLTNFKTCKISKNRRIHKDFQDKAIKPAKPFTIFTKCSILDIWQVLDTPQTPIKTKLNQVV